MQFERHDRSAPATALRAMFAARKEVFVDLLKWEVPVLAGKYELDQFDDEHACYLILADREQRHLGSARLLPTTRPHILADIYPHLCEGPPPSAPEILEITRFCLDRSLRAPERRQVRDGLVAYLVDHALAHEITSYIAIAELGWLVQIMAFGWECRPLGPTREVAGKHLGAVQIFVDAATLRLIEDAGIVACAARLAA